MPATNATRTEYGWECLDHHPEYGPYWYNDEAKRDADREWHNGKHHAPAPSQEETNR